MSDILTRLQTEIENAAYNGDARVVELLNPTIAEIVLLRDSIAELERKAARWDECERMAVSSSDTIKYSNPVTIYYWRVTLRAANSRQSFAAAIDAAIEQRAKETKT